MNRSIIDLFSGPGGWSEGLKQLGFSSLGIEWDPYAAATARRAGHPTIEADVSKLDPQTFAPVWGLIASPPCQSYSNAGRGLGRQDKPEVVQCSLEAAAGRDTRECRLARCRDARSLLTVEAIRWALALRPRWIAFEQVPAVLELWELYAEILRGEGYHTATGKLSAEQYGVPQTRKRAFLIASLDGPVALPDPTPRAPVTMAQALGWVPGLVVNTRGNRDPRSGGNEFSADRPSWALTSKARSWKVNGRHLLVQEASILQGFRPDYPWQGSRSRQFLQVGDAVAPPVGRAVLAEAMRPSLALREAA